MNRRFSLKLFVFMVGLIGAGLLPGAQAHNNVVVIPMGGENPINCNGGTLNGTRWCNNGDGTVTDMTTGLVWLRIASCFGKKPWIDTTTWNDAQTSSGRITSGGGCLLTDGSMEGDWRLPTKNELYGLANGTERVRSNTPRAFLGVQSDNYWSSTTYGAITSNAFFLELSFGNMVSASKSNSYYVWPVRTGQ